MAHTVVPGARDDLQDPKLTTVQQQTHAHVAATPRAPPSDHDVAPTRLDPPPPPPPPPKPLFEQLRDVVVESVEPWAKNSQRPDYSLEEIVVMALVVQRTATAEQVQQWIFEHFGHYRRLGYSFVWSQSAWSYQHIRREPRDFLTAFRKVFTAFDVPLQKVNGAPLGLQLETDVWEVSQSGATIFLADRFPLKQSAHLKASSTGFRLLDLPPELRSVIYDMVFGFPDSGICIADTGPCDRSPRMRRQLGRPDTVFRVLTRSYEMKAHIDQWCPSSADRHTAILNNYGQHFLRPRPLPDILSLTLVNKQIYAECKFNFFICNNFTYPHMCLLLSFLNGLSRERLEHIGKITFAYRPNEVHNGPRALRLITQMTHLRELVVHINEKEWLDVKNKNKNKNAHKVRKYANVKNIPGLWSLKHENCIKVVRFVGECDKIRKMMDSAAKKLKEKEERDKKSAKGKGAKVANKATRQAKKVKQ